MATKTAPAIPSPFVAEGLRLRAEQAQLKDERDALVAEHEEKLKALDAAIVENDAQLIALGAGRYCDAADRTATVVAGVAASLSPDTFTLKSAEDEARARELVGEDFLKLFDRHVYFTPCDGFGAVAPKLLTPAKARDIIALTIVPGQLTGGRRAYVRWK